MSVQVSTHFADSFPDTLKALRRLRVAITTNSNDLAGAIDELSNASRREGADPTAVNVYAAALLRSGAIGSGGRRPVWISDTDTNPVIPFFYTADSFTAPQLPATQKPVAAGTVLNYILDTLSFVPTQVGTVKTLNSTASLIYGGLPLSFTWSQVVGKMALIPGFCLNFSTTSDQVTLKDTIFDWTFFPYGNSPPDAAATGQYTLRTTSLKSVARSVLIPIADSAGISTMLKVMFANAYQGGANMPLTLNLSQAPFVPGGLSIDVEPFSPASALYLPIVRGLLAVCQGKMSSVGGGDIGATVESATTASEYGSSL